MHPKDIGIRIRQVRQHLDMTQTEFADVAGVSRAATVSQWETGKEIPGTDKLKAIAAAVGEDPAYLFGVFGDERLRYGHGEENDEFTRGLRAKLPEWRGLQADYAEMSKSMDPDVVREDLLRTYPRGRLEDSEGPSRNGTSELARQIDEINHDTALTRQEKDRAVAEVSAAYRAEALRDEAAAARERGAASRIEAIKAPNRNVREVANSDLEAILFQFAEIIQRMHPATGGSPATNSNEARGSTD